MNFSSLIAKVILALPWPARIKTGFRIDQGTNEELLENHIVIIGFGISGKNLARSSILAGVPYIILEMNPDTVREYKKQGEPIYFGDASHLSVLEHVQIQKAKALAVLINDPVAAQRIVKLAREVNPSIYIIVRTRYVHDMPLLNNLGADEVIPDEFGTSVEIFSRVLRQYHVPTDEIDKFIGEIRADGYEILRTRHKEPSKLSDIKMSLSNVELYSFRIQPASVLVGKTLIESQIRQNYGLTVLLIRRGSKILATPASDTVLMAQDVVVVVGERVPIQEAQALFVG
jgi:CPA2 family monovalent cation:H+ antiporter-2